MSIPRYLYRYTSFKYLESIFAHNTLYFCSPNNINDPFDCKTSFSPPVPDEESEETSRDWEKIVREYSSRCGILCLSEVPDDILMWSHYGDKHQGVVLRFDGKGISEMGYCSNIEYDENLVDYKQFLSNYPHNRKELYRLFMFRKSLHWKYESEWRIFHEPAGFVPFSPKMLTGLILGCEMNESNRKIVKEYRRRYNLNMAMFEAKRSRNRYCITIEPLEDDGDSTFAETTD
jgi:hypothetical protein